MASPFSQKPSIPNTITEPTRDGKAGAANDNTASSVAPVANDNFAQRQARLYARRVRELILLALHRRAAARR
jgi:hypothetical protein